VLQIPIFIAGKAHGCEFPAQAADFPRMNEKSALLQARIDFAYSLLWFALDALWMLGLPQWTAASGLLTGIIAIVALRFSSTRTATLMNVFALAWVAMDTLWVFDELTPLVSEYSLHRGLSGISSVLALAALSSAIVGRRKGDGDFWGLANTFLWFAMDAAWLFGLMDLTRSLALLALASGAMTVIRSLSRGERLVNTAMVCWIAMDVAQLAAECFDYSFIPAVEYAFCGLTVGFLFAGWLSAGESKRALDCFRRVRVHAHEEKEPVSFMPPSPIEIVTTPRAGYVEVAVKGRIDALTADRFLATVREAVAKGFKVVRVEAQEVNYVSSLGLRVFLILWKELAAKGGKFSIHNASSNVLNILFVAGFGAMLEGGDDNTHGK
jgi:anti-anti-sigma factor